MERWLGKVAVVTGASAGIGLEVAKALVKNGMVVFGLARRVEKMQDGMNSIKSLGKFHPLGCDVSKKSEVIKAFQIIENQYKTEYKTVHILINNAGLAISGTIQGSETEDLQKVVDVNVMGILHCTRQALKLMKKDDEGHIVNVNSVKTDFFDSAQVQDFLSDRPALNPEDVASSIVHVISAPPHVQITELTIKPLGQLH